MKKLFVSVFAVALLLLTGCGGDMSENAKIKPKHADVITINGDIMIAELDYIMAIESYKSGELTKDQVVKKLSPLEAELSRIFSEVAKFDWYGNSMKDYADAVEWEIAAVQVAMRCIEAQDGIPSDIQLKTEDVRLDRESKYEIMVDEWFR